MMAQLKLPIGAAKHRMAKEHPDLDTGVLDLPSDALAPFPRTKVKASVQKETPAHQKADSAPSAEVLTNCQNLAEVVANTDNLEVVANCDHLGPRKMRGLR